MPPALSQLSRYFFYSTFTPLWLLLICLGTYAQNIQADEIRIAVRAHNGLKQAFQQWQPTVDYLAQRIPEHHFRLVPIISLNELTEAAGRKEFEFVLTNPSSYIEINHYHRAERILTLRNRFQDQALTSFGAVVFTLASRDDLNGFKDLKGKKLMAVSETAFGGWRVAWHEMLHRHHINPYKTLSSIQFAHGIQQNVVKHVLQGDVDVGVVRTNMLEQLAAQGKIRLDSLKIINPIKHSDFPYLLSTELYPEWPLVKLSHTSYELANKVAIALLQMPETDLAAIRGHYVGWSVPLEYYSVSHLMQELKIGPFANTTVLTVREVIDQYWYWLLLFALFILAVLFFAAHITRTNFKLRHTRSSLENTRKELENRVASRTEKLNNTIQLLDSINLAQTVFINSRNENDSFELILNAMLRMTNSEHGFIANVEHDADNKPQLKIRVLAHLHEDQQVAQLQPISAQIIEFHDSNSLLGQVIITGEVVISNHPERDPRATGNMPQNLPPITSFLGIPVYFKDVLYGIVGLCNCKNGYNKESVDELIPLLVTISNLMDAVRIRALINESQNELIANKNHLEHLLTSSPVIIYELDMHNYFKPLFVSKNIHNILGYTPDECLQENEWWKNHIHPGDQSRTLSYAQTIFDEPGIQHEYRFLKKDGSYCWIHDELRVVYDREGTPIRVVGSWYDITERKKYENELRQTNYMLKMVLDLIPVTLFWKDRDGKYLGANQRFIDFAGLNTLEELIGKDDFDMPWATWAEMYRSDDQQVMNTLQAKLNYEEPVNYEDGTTSWLSTSKIPLLDQNGQAYGVLGSFHDITEQKRLEQIKNEFISTVSHEIRTPLTSIRGALGLLTTHCVPQLSADELKLLTIASSNSERLLLLINDILDIQKIESGTIEFDFENLALMPLIEQSLADNQSYADQYKVEFIITKRLEDVMVCVDKTRFNQVMSNLLSNAAKFSPPGNKVEVLVSTHDSLLRIEVVDHGSGIPEQFKHKLFERFTQADASDTKQKGGTGLGLAITKSLVEKLGGDIGFTSQKGVGSTFYIELPAL